MCVFYIDIIMLFYVYMKNLLENSYNTFEIAFKFP